MVERTRKSHTPPGPGHDRSALDLSPFLTQDQAPQHRAAVLSRPQSPGGSEASPRVNSPSAAGPSCPCRVKTGTSVAAASSSAPKSRPWRKIGDHPAPFNAKQARGMGVPAWLRRNRLGGRFPLPLPPRVRSARQAPLVDDRLIRRRVFNGRRSGTAAAPGENCSLGLKPPAPSIRI